MLDHDEHRLHDPEDFRADAAYLKAVQAIGADMVAAKHMTDRDALARMVAMRVLTAFANAGGLNDPHVGRLMRFADALALLDAPPKLDA